MLGDTKSQQPTTMHITRSHRESRSQGITTLLESFYSVSDLGAGGGPDPKLSEAERTRTAMRDKVAIALNTSQLNVMYNLESNSATKDDSMTEHLRRMALISLAERAHSA